MDAKNRSSLAIVNWAFRCVIRIAGVKVIALGEENLPKDSAVLSILKLPSWKGRKVSEVLLRVPSGKMQMEIPLFAFSMARTISAKQPLPYPPKRLCGSAALHLL